MVVFALPIVLLLVLAVVGGIVLVIVKAGPKVRVGILVAGGIVGVVVLAGLFYVRLRSDREPIATVRGTSVRIDGRAGQGEVTTIVRTDGQGGRTVTRSSVAEAEPAELPAQPKAVAWPEENPNLPLEADVYPSASSAARSLAFLVAKDIADATEGDVQAPAITVLGEYDARMGEFAPALSKALPSAKVTVNERRSGRKPSASSPASARSEIEIVLTQPRVSFRSDRSSDARGELQAVTTFRQAALEASQPAATRESSHSVSWVAKPWVENLSEFLGRLPSGERRDWIVARSDSACDNESEAMNQAYARAVEQLLPRLAFAYRQQGGLVSAGPDQQAMRNDLLARVRNGGGFSTNVFTQKITRPYGSVYRSAVLVNAAPVQEMADTYVGAYMTKRSGWVRTALSMGGLAVLITLVYLFLDAGTKGYYRWRLRFVLAIVAVVGLMLLAIIA